MGGGREGRCGRVVPRRTQIMKKTILIWMGLACGLVGVLEARTWTSGDGRKLDAEFISATDRYVTVRREADGKRFTMELAKISEADREWVRVRWGLDVELCPSGASKAAAFSAREKSARSTAASCCARHLHHPCCLAHP